MPRNIHVYNNNDDDDDDDDRTIDDNKLYKVVQHTHNMSIYVHGIAMYNVFP